MKKILSKKAQHIKNYKKNEFCILIEKIIFISLNILILKKIIDFKSVFKNFCFQSGIQRSINNLVSIGRMHVKQNLIDRTINGVKKITW